MGTTSSPVILQYFQFSQRNAVPRARHFFFPPGLLHSSLMVAEVLSNANQQHSADELRAFMLVSTSPGCTGHPFRFWGVPLLWYDFLGGERIGRSIGRPGYGIPAVISPLAPQRENHHSSKETILHKVI